MLYFSRRRRLNANINPVPIIERPLPGWLHVDIDRLDDLNFEGSDDDEDTDYDTDASTDDTSSTTSSNEVPMPLFDRINDDDEDDDDEEGDEDENLIQWHPDPFEPFGMNFERGMDLNNFMDVFRRIAYGLNSTRSSIQLDTLPAPRPLDPEKIDLYNGNLPPLGSIPMHRNFLIPPFTNVIVSNDKNHFFHDLNLYYVFCPQGSAENLFLCNQFLIISWLSYVTTTLRHLPYPRIPSLVNSAMKFRDLLCFISFLLHWQ